MHELDICDGVLVWLTTTGNQVMEEAIYLLGTLTVPGSAILGDCKLIQPFGLDANTYQ